MLFLFLKFDFFSGECLDEVVFYEIFILLLPALPSKTEFKVLKTDIEIDILKIWNIAV